MTIQEIKEEIDILEAIDILLEELDAQFSYKVSEALRLAIEALEKQIPKKPVDKLMYLECPSCEYVGVFDCAYCSACGQKLDWSD